MARKRTPNKWVIRSMSESDPLTYEPLYWSNDDGWVSRAGATIFTTLETISFNRPANSYFEGV